MKIFIDFKFFTNVAIYPDGVSNSISSPPNSPLIPPFSNSSLEKQGSEFIFEQILKT